MSKVKSAKVPSAKVVPGEGKRKSPEIKDTEDYVRIFTGFFNSILPRINDVLMKLTHFKPNGNDCMRKLENLLTRAAELQNVGRFLYEPLMYLKQHRNLLSHTLPVRIVDVKKAILNLGSLVVCFNILDEDSTLILKCISFYEDYANLAIEKKIFASGAFRKENFNAIKLKCLENIEKKEKEEKDEKDEDEENEEFEEFDESEEFEENEEFQEDKGKEEDKDNEEGKEEEVLPIEKKMRSLNLNAEPFIPFIPPVPSDSSSHSSSTSPCCSSSSSSSSSSENNGEMPQGLTIDEYKRAGFSVQIKTKLLTPLTGDLQGYYFEILKFNGNTTLFKICEQDGERYLQDKGRNAGNKHGIRYFSSHIPFQWKEME